MSRRRRAPCGPPATQARSPRLLRSTAVAVVTAALCAGTLAGCSPAGDAEAGAPEASQAAVARSTSPVVLGDLVDGKRIPATLGYGTLVPLRSGTSGGAGAAGDGAAGDGAGGGVITGLPAFGDVIGRDGVLYSVDEREVRAMHGSVPLWRDLEQGLRGADVDQLKDNLRALGYDVVDDDRFDARTRAAVMRWQKDRGRERTGVLGARDLAFVPGDVRVAELTGRVGDPVGEPLYGYTSTTLVATASVSAADLVRFQGGVPVQVALPDGSEVPGTVRSIGEPSGGAGDESANGGDDGVTVTVGLGTAPPEGTSTSTRVDLVVDGERRDGVLSVPVTALLAGTDGYTVEVVQDDGSTDLVPVTTGFFAQGRVEVSGEGLAEGDEVVVPS
jgi:peptidoglycan hydrolase-like protein with peptidoglycan-binding domain